MAQIGLSKGNLIFNSLKKQRQEGMSVPISNRVLVPDQQMSFMLKLKNNSVRMEGKSL